MTKDILSIDPDWVEQIAAILQKYGVFAFAIISLVCIAVFYRDRILRFVFAAFFAVAAGAGAWIQIVPTGPLRIVAGNFGHFTVESEARVWSSDGRFFVAHRNHNPTSMRIDWVFFVANSSFGGDQPLSFSFQEKRRRVVLGNNLEKKEENAVLGGLFEIPTKYLGNEADKPVNGNLPFLPLSREIVDQDGTSILCFSGLKERICGKPIGGVVSAAPPAPTPVREGSLPRWLHDTLFPPAAAQRPDDPTTPAAVQAALMSSDPRRLAEVSKVIEKSPEAYAGVINTVLGRPLEASPYTARLAIVTALRNHYRAKALTYPDSASLAWLNDASWRRIVLDAFDRSDPLGESSRRLLRVLKTTQAKGVLDNTLDRVKAGVGASLDKCLDLLRQDVYVNWAMLSFANLKDAKQLTPERLLALGALLDEIAVTDDQGFADPFRLRVNYVKGALMLEAADALPAKDRAPFESLGLREMQRVKQGIDKIGLAALRPDYPVNPVELDKTNLFFARLSETKEVSLEPLREASTTAHNPYPSCKLGG